jgi:hypothetical protein
LLGQSNACAALGAAGALEEQEGWDAGLNCLTVAGTATFSEILPGTIKRLRCAWRGGGLNENTPYCLRLDIEDISGGRIGIANEGFGGIGLQEGQEYDLVLHARSTDGFNGPLTASRRRDKAAMATARLEDSGGSACSQLVKLEGVSSQWKQFKATLTATRTEPEARFVITAGSTGKIWFDFVSLFPQACPESCEGTGRETCPEPCRGNCPRKVPRLPNFQADPSTSLGAGRPNGLRRDIAEMIADLKPGFVRFPGGCVVEGGNIETAYNWKLTVGAVEERTRAMECVELPPDARHGPL